jgi:hypothetical protein
MMREHMPYRSHLMRSIASCQTRVLFRRQQSIEGKKNGKTARAKWKGFHSFQRCSTVPLKN